MSFFPFGQQSATSQPPINYDLVIDKAFPRVGFVPTETSGVYQEFVEVLGDLWFVTNATWDDTLQGFYQEITTLANCNPSAAAFAWVMRGVGGDAIRMFSPPTGNTTTEITWVPTFDTSPFSTTLSPQTLNNPSGYALAVNATLNGGNSAVLPVFVVNANVLSANPLSPLEQFSVNGNVVWSVDTTGTLRVGSVSSATLDPACYTTLTAGTGIATIGPAPSATIGLLHGDYVDLPNAQSITGSKTFASLVPTIFGGGWGNVVGGSGDDIYECSGCELLSTNPLTAVAQNAYATIVALKPAYQPVSGSYESLMIFVNSGLSIGTTFSPTPVMYIDSNGNLTLLQGGLSVGGNASISGNFAVVGNLTVTGTSTLDGPLVLGPAALTQLETYFEPNPSTAFPTNATDTSGAGLIISYQSSNNTIEFDTSSLMLIGATSATGLTSNDGSLTITKNQGSTQNVDLSIGGSGVVTVYFSNVTTPVKTPRICYGTSSVTLTGTSGPNSGTSGTTTVNLPITYNATGYGVSILPEDHWVMWGVHSKTTSGFVVDMGNPFPSGNQTITFSYITVGN